MSEAKRVVEGLSVQSEKTGTAGTWIGVAVVVAALSLNGGTLSTAGLDLYVSPHGDDSWSGRAAVHRRAGADGPVATLERARDLATELRATGKVPRGVTIWLEGGVYVRQSTFILDGRHAGTADRPVVIAALPGQEVRLTGGRAVNDWRPVSDPRVLDRLDNGARGHVLQADLRDQGITDYGELRPRGFGRPIAPSGLELFFQDRPMHLARWPNQGWASITNASESKQEARFSFQNDRILRWTTNDDLWVHGYWTWDWADSYEKVREIDPLRRTITTERPGVYGFKKGQRFYVLNSLEELECPGEWYLDRKQGIVYFWPPAPIQPGQTVVSVLSDTLLVLKETAFVTIRGLTLESGRGNGAEIDGGHDNELLDCQIRNFGGVGVVITGDNREREDGLRNTPFTEPARESGNEAAGCRIEHTGEAAVILDGGNRRTLSPGDNVVQDCEVSDFNRWVRTGRAGIVVSGVGNRVAHNHLHHAPHTAIQLRGNDHCVEFNEIDHVCLEVNDAGAFYMGRDFTERGNIVRYNYFHDLGVGAVQSVYLDDCASGTTVYGNLFCRAGRGVLIGGGRDNRVENNVFVACRPAVHVDARGIGWARFWFDGRDRTLMDRLAAVNFRHPPYSTRYPQLATILNEDPALPKGNIIRHNINVDGPWIELSDGLNLLDRLLTVGDNWIVGDPGFVDAVHRDFRLEPGAPAWTIGFQPIPFKNIGPRHDHAQVSMPRQSRGL